MSEDPEWVNPEWVNPEWDNPERFFYVHNEPEDPKKILWGEHSKRLQVSPNKLDNAI